MPTLPEVPDGPSDAANTTTAAALAVEAGAEAIPEDSAEQCNAELKAAEDQVEATAELVNEQMVRIPICHLLHRVPVSGPPQPPPLFGRELHDIRLTAA